MKYSQIKTIKTFCDNLFSAPDYREVIDNIVNNEPDFEVNNVRFISEEIINEVLKDELESGPYILGCFNDWFLADVTGWPVELIQAAQKGEAFEALGEAIINSGKTLELAESYASADGYGHHFNSYDGNEEELTINGQTYYVFDNH